MGSCDSSRSSRYHRGSSKEAGIIHPSNLEEMAISLVGTEIYEKLIKGYTEKQWGRSCRSLPPFIIRRLPVRLNYNNNYFNSIYQGIPVGGYTQMVERMLQGVQLQLGEDYLQRKEYWDSMANRVIFTGAIDAFLIIALVRSNIVLFVLKRNVLICQIIRVTLW